MTRGGRTNVEPSRLVGWWVHLDRGWQASAVGLALLVAVLLLV